MPATATKKSKETFDEIAMIIDLLHDEVKCFELMQSAESWQAKTALFNLKKVLKYQRKGQSE